MKIIGNRSWAFLAAMVVLTGSFVAGCAGTGNDESPVDLTPAQAASHIGEEAIVTGTVVSADYRPANDGAPTFLDLDVPYPNPVFIALIWGKDRAKFGTPEDTYKGKKISVTGKITIYHDKATFEVSDPGQIRVVQ